MSDQNDHIRKRLKGMKEGEDKISTNIITNNVIIDLNTADIDSSSNTQRKQCIKSNDFVGGIKKNNIIGNVEITGEIGVAGESLENPVDLISDDDDDDDGGDDDDDDDDRKEKKKSSLSSSNLQLKVNSKRVEFNVEKAILGDITLAHGQITHIAFTPSIIIITDAQGREATIDTSISKPFIMFGVNTMFPPLFMAIHPRYKLREEWTFPYLNPTVSEPKPGERDKRFVILYFEQEQDLRQVQTAINTLCPNVKSASTSLSEDDTALFDVLHVRRIRNRTRSATNRSRAMKFCAPVHHRTTFLQYPAMSKQSIALVAEDLEALSAGEFLNDTIIDFYLRYLQETKMDQQRFYFFSSFFYKRYVSSQKETRYDDVRRWTRHVDIFDKEFILFPVCENLHWFCVVVCHAGLNISERTDTRYPCMLLMNSLESSATHHKIFRILRNYLSSEWLHRKHDENIFNGENLPGFVMEVPSQKNNCDCGVFLLQYVESFIDSPPQNLKKTELHRPNWFSQSIIVDKRDQIRSILLELHSEYLNSLETKKNDVMTSVTSNNDCVVDVDASSCELATGKQEDCKDVEIKNSE